MYVSAYKEIIDEGETWIGFRLFNSCLIPVICLELICKLTYESWSLFHDIETQPKKKTWPYFSAFLAFISAMDLFCGEGLNS